MPICLQIVRVRDDDGPFWHQFDTNPSALCLSRT
jgi:hypothetical protein